MEACGLVSYTSLFADASSKKLVSCADIRLDTSSQLTWTRATSISNLSGYSLLRKYWNEDVSESGGWQERTRSFALPGPVMLRWRQNPDGTWKAESARRDCLAAMQSFPWPGLHPPPLLKGSALEVVGPLLLLQKGRLLDARFIYASTTAGTLQPVEAWGQDATFSVRGRPGDMIGTVRLTCKLGQLLGGAFRVPEDVFIDGLQHRGGSVDVKPNVVQQLAQSWAPPQKKSCESLVPVTIQETASVILPVDGGYYAHFITITLPGLLLLQLNNLTDTVVVTDNSVPPYMRDALELLRVKNVLLPQSCRPVLVRKAYVAHAKLRYDLYANTGRQPPMFGFGMIDDFPQPALRPIRDLFMPLAMLAGSSAAVRQHVLLVTRSASTGAGARIIANGQRVAAVARRTFGESLLSFDSSGQSWASQITHFRHAAAAIMVLGSGLANTIWMEPNRSIATIAPTRDIWDAMLIPVEACSSLTCWSALPSVFLRHDMYVLHMPNESFHASHFVVPLGGFWRMLLALRQGLSSKGERAITDQTALLRAEREVVAAIATRRAPISRGE
eukprot:TRINITY_DN24415_c0_g1_i2.p1 TRINITY_DN24415_c0_g1~~TRINITY_DN24415_c0_g1_i2.p1  ORF type:complete len:558 (-),score=25.71 TRINITY_DN24415_c0_g1_i2:204-1877(-)